MIIAKDITIVGAGIVGMAAASYLRRDGHAVTVVDMRPPGEYCSAGNAGILSPGSCVLFGLPGNLKNVPRWLNDPLGPLAISPGYFLRAGLGQVLNSGSSGNRVGNKSDKNA